MGEGRPSSRPLAVRALTRFREAMGRFDVDLKSGNAPTMIAAMAPDGGNR
jgi:hypothetical protein